MIRMLIWRRKKTFYTDAVINDPGKIFKLAAMHLFARKFG
jgi:hypothetical protein